MHAHVLRKGTGTYGHFCPSPLQVVPSVYPTPSSPMGLRTPTGSRKKQLSCTKKSVTSPRTEVVRHSVRTHNTGKHCEFVGNIAQDCFCASLKKWLARDPPLLRPGDAQMLCEVLEANSELGTRGQIVSRLQYLEVVYGELVTDILGVTTQSLCTDVSMSAGFSDVPTFATLKSFLETAPCTHKCWTLTYLVLPPARLRYCRRISVNGWMQLNVQVRGDAHQR